MNPVCALAEALLKISVIFSVFAMFTLTGYATLGAALDTKKRINRCGLYNAFFNSPD